MKHPHSIFSLSLKLRLTLLAIATMAALRAAPVDESPENETTDSVELERYDVTGERAYTYSTETTVTATKMPLSPRDTPQSLSVITPQLIEDHLLYSLNDVAKATNGLSTSLRDSDRTAYYSRGFIITSYQYDGMPTSSLGGAYAYGDEVLDTSVYDRIEVVRGATGLLNGPGTPSASLNLIRKHALSHELTGSVTASVGSWDTYRGSVDITTPVTADGSVRARFVTTYEERDSYIDLYHNEKAVFYGVVDADISDSTLLSVGYDYQETTPEGSTWGGFPLWYADGTRTDWSTDVTTAADWSSWATKSQTGFISLDHFFANDWKLRTTYHHSENDFDARLLYLYGYPDADTGLGMGGGAGRYVGDRKQDSFDLYVTGLFTLFGREHELVTGFTASEQKGHVDGTYLDAGTIGDFNEWDGSIAEPDWGDLYAYENATIRQTGTYAAFRLSVTDDLLFVTGARYSTWKHTGGASSYDYKEPTLYGGAIYRINDTYSAYLSYTDIFEPQTSKDASNNLVDAILGTNLEAGLKAEYFDRRLNLSVAVFRTEQDNAYETDYATLLPDGSYAVYSVGPIVSEGIEGEISGQLYPGLQISLGASHYTIENDEGDPVSTDQPRTQVKLLTSYQLPGDMKRLTIGGGLTWQSRNYTLGYGPLGEEKLQQDAYALVSAFARYRLTDALTTQVNVENLTDEKYYDQIGFYSQGSYGAPRSISLTLKYTF